MRRRHERVTDVWPGSAESPTTDERKLEARWGLMQNPNFDYQLGQNPNLKLKKGHCFHDNDDEFVACLKSLTFNKFNNMLLYKRWLPGLDTTMI